MRLRIEPSAGLIDQPPAVVIDDVPAGSKARLTVSTTDDRGHRWRSEATYVAGRDGVLGIADPDRPWWDMAFEDRSTAPVTFSAPEDGLDYDVEVFVDGATSRATVRRSWSVDVSVEDITGHRWRLRLFRPRHSSGSTAGVLVVPGSTGMAAMTPTAALLASHGYVAAVLGYMQEAGLPPSFQRIPVETVLEAWTAFTGRADVAADRCGVLAVSVGTSLALSALAGPEAPAVRGVVVTAPTHVVWQAVRNGGRPPAASSLTRRGVDLPYVKLQGQRLIGQLLRRAVVRRLSRHPTSSALTMLPAYTAGLRDRAAVDRAAIPVERIAAPLLAIAGSRDQMWPSSAMSETLMTRRRAAGVGGDDRLLVLVDAGHFLRPPATPTTVDRNESLVSGGTPEGSARGQRAAWDTTLAFFEGCLSP